MDRPARAHLNNITAKMRHFNTLLFLLFIDQLIGINGAISTSFPIGGLFNALTRDTSKLAFEKIATMGTTRAYQARVFYPQVTDIYSTSLEVCQLTSDGQNIVALIDARPSKGICDDTCLLCNRLNISHLLLAWEPPETLMDDPYTFAYHPPFELISQAFSALIKYLEWDQFTVFYEDEGSFVRLQEVINSWPSDKEPIVYRKLDPKGDNRETFKHTLKVSRMTRHILDCDAENIQKYMEEVVLIDNSTRYQSFLFTSLDAHTVNLSAVTSLDATVSTMHFTDANDVKWRDIGIDVKEGAKIETALVADALAHIEKAIRTMQIDEGDNSDASSVIWRNTQQDFGTPPSICYAETNLREQAWTSGYDLRAALFATSTTGFTGNIQFDEFGRRTGFLIKYSTMNDEKIFSRTGFWDSRTNLINTEPVVPNLSSPNGKGTIRVLSKIGKPYFNLKGEGNKEPEGYAVDLVREIFKIINENGSNYELEFNCVTCDERESYGSPVEGSKKWDGFIGELQSFNADLAVGDLSITAERHSVIDFSIPFMTTGISILMKVPDPVEPDRFSFINPLALDVWLYLATTYIIVSFVLLICARMSQDDWVNPHPCNQNPENLQNIWSLYNCMWLTMGTIMTQGCDILPRGFGSRWVTGMWWFFAMIVTASYTANMSTFISNNRRDNDIKDANELAEQSKVSYGCVKDSATCKFFQSSKDPTFSKIWSVMSTAKPTVFTKSNPEGKDRVIRSKGNYAFFMEATAIKYNVVRSCELRMVGPELDNKAYGIAMPKNSPLKSQIDRAILLMQESGNLLKLETLWWKEMDKNNVTCPQFEKEDDSLQMKNTSGIFIVLIAGGVLGLFVAIIDFMMHARKISVKERLSFSQALASEWRASLNPRTLHKPVAPTRSAPTSESPSPQRERSRSRAVSVLKAATSFINFDEIY